MFSKWFYAIRDPFKIHSQTSVPSQIQIVPASSLLQILPNDELTVSDYIRVRKQCFHDVGVPLHVTTYVVPVVSERYKRRSAVPAELTSLAAIHVIHGNPEVNSEADDIFEKYQKVASEKPFFQRHVSHVSDVRPIFCAELDG
jgi:hypothetical protein